MTGNRMRIFCPIHEASFEAPVNRKILCEITGHTLSTSFPNSELWEFCCNCETFGPSKLGKGEKARATCFSCQNEITNRFACDQCKTFSFECGSRARGKSYFVTEKGIEPSCPGCGGAVHPQSVISHDCKDAGAVFFTAQETCPFCLEKTVLQDRPDRGTSSQLCPQCNSPILHGSTFCSRCRHQLRSDAGIDRLGTDTVRSKALGSLCPNCSTPIPPDSEFCGECGQAVIVAIPPPPPPPPPPKKEQTGGVHGYTATTTDPIGDKPIIATPTAAPTFKILAAIAAGLFIVIGIFIGFNSVLNANSNKSTITKNYNVIGNNSYSNNSPSSLPYEFDSTYKGTVGPKKMSISMSLVKRGRELSGSAWTTKTDILKGNIDSYGKFELTGYEEGNESMESRYSGSISTDGRIVGSWFGGGREVSFSLTRN